MYVYYFYNIAKNTWEVVPPRSETIRDIPGIDWNALCTCNECEWIVPGTLQP